MVHKVSLDLLTVKRSPQKRLKYIQPSRKAQNMLVLTSDINLPKRISNS